MNFENSCDKIGDLLPGYAVGTLSPAEMRDVADHLGQCADCRSRLREWRLIAAAANVAASGPPPSPDIPARIQARVDAAPSSRQVTRHPPRIWMTDGHRPHRRRASPAPPAESGRAGPAGQFLASRKSRVAELAVIAVLVVVVSGGLLGTEWWANPPGDIPTTRDDPTTQSAAQTPVTGSLMFVSDLTNEATHPGAQLRLGRLTMEPDSSTELRAEESAIALLIEIGNITGVADGPAIVIHGDECEFAGQTDELAIGEPFELRSSDQLHIPFGTVSELRNEGQAPAHALDIRVLSPGPPPTMTNGVEHQRLAQAAARHLPSGQFEYALTVGSIATGEVIEVDGPVLFYVESGTLEFIETNVDVEIKGRDDPEVVDVADRDNANPGEPFAGESWFFLQDEDQVSLTVPEGEATYIELLFEPVIDAGLTS